jgi:thioester reductase-like protein
MEAMALEKCVPVSGDLIVEGLGLAPEQRQILVQELDVIINCAASVNFDDPLLDAIQINYIGCLRMVELAQECQHLKAHVHVSTTYTNADRRGFVEEKVYDLPGQEDPEAVIHNIMNMNPQYREDNEQ